MATKESRALKPHSISSRLPVPSHIRKPPYVDTGEMPWGKDPEIPSPEVPFSGLTSLSAERSKFSKSRGHLDRHAEIIPSLSRGALMAGTERHTYMMPHASALTCLSQRYPQLQEIVKMRAACKLAAQVLQYAGTLVEVIFSIQPMPYSIAIFE